MDVAVEAGQGSPQTLLVPETLPHRGSVGLSQPFLDYLVKKSDALHGFRGIGASHQLRDRLPDEGSPALPWRGSAGQVAPFSSQLDVLANRAPVNSQAGSGGLDAAVTLPPETVALASRVLRYNWTSKEGCPDPVASGKEGPGPRCTMRQSWPIYLRSGCGSRNAASAPRGPGWT